MSKHFDRKYFLLGLGWTCKEEKKMELGTQIKKYRQELQISQEELADRVYVSRQTISNWENDKSYPDVHSLMLLSEIFHISLDNLIKGDIEMMKETIQKDDIKKLKHYYFVAGGALLIACLLVSPLVLWIGQWTFIPVGMLFAVAFCCLAAMDKVEKNNDLKTFKEIMAFMDGKRLDEEEKQRSRARAKKTRIVQFATSFLLGLVTSVGIISLVKMLLDLLQLGK